jgi:hypothetical protein
VAVDNTPPVIQKLRLEGPAVKGSASDRIGPIARIEFRLAGDQEWLPLDPKDGIFDESAEDFEASASALAPQGGLATFRVFDTAGNFQIEHLRLPSAR